MREKRGLTSRRRYFAFSSLVGLLALFAGLLVALPTTASAAPGDVGYQDQSYSGTGTPTGSKRSESVLWWNDGSWWANMWSTAAQDFHVFRLNLGTQTWQDTGVTIDTRSNTHADVLWDGAHLYVASHEFVADETAATSGTPSYLFRFSYNTTTKTYSPDSGFPVQINNMKTETLVIDKDSTGKIWATWQQNNTIYLNRTLNGDDRQWGTPFALPNPAANVTVDDNSALIAFGGNKMGIMWSNQTGSNYAMWFAFHQDGSSDSSWSAGEKALQGPSDADDHINLKSLQADGSGRVFAATKTSNSSSSTALIMLSVRSATGSWSRNPIALVSDCPNRPLVLIDEQNNVLHTFYTAPGPPNYACNSSGGAIYEKTSPLNSVSFGPGRGTPVIVDADSPFVHNASSTKQNVNGSTGIVVLAVNDQTKNYWHHYESLGAPPPPQPPVASFNGSPTSGTAPLSVAFTDTSTGPPTSWAWTFGDGGTSTAQSPSHTYSAQGTYSVSLHVTNSLGSNTLTKTNYISVAAPQPPVANFSGSPTNGITPLTVNFADTSSGQPTSWAWTFGDGGTSNVQNPSHVYTVAGTYTVTLTATNIVGSNMLTKTNYITVTPPPPDFTISVSPAKQTVHKGGSTSYTITITPRNGFTGQVTLSLSGQPSGASTSFSVNPVNGSTTASSTLLIGTNSTTKNGGYTLTITATGGGLTHTAAVALQVKH
jgi:PKD repeat protein